MKNNRLHPRHRILAGIFTTILAFTGLSATMAPASFAGPIIDIGDEVGTGGGATPGQPNPAPGGGGNTGGTGGGWTPVDRYAPYWVTSWGFDLGCPFRGDVGASIGSSQMWQIETAITPSGDTLPGGDGWIDTGTYIQGYGEVWERTIRVGGVECHYPPRYELVSHQCILSTTATITQRLPWSEELGSNTNMSGYTAGNPSPEACKNSRSSAFVGVGMKRYSIADAVVSSVAINNTFKVYLEADPRTGQIPSPELQAQGAPFKLAPKARAITWTCKGVLMFADTSVSDWTDNYCNPSKGGGSTYQCNVSPVQFFVPLGNATTPTWNSFPNNGIQYMTSTVGNPGQNIRYNQNVTGKGVHVNTYNTSYASSLINTELDILTVNGKVANRDVLTGAKNTSGTFDGQKNDVNLVFYGATEKNNNMKLTQIQKWTGTRSVSKPSFSTADPITGEPTLSYGTVNLPTSGKCEQTADIEVLRAIGDTVY